MKIALQLCLVIALTVCFPLSGCQQHKQHQNQPPNQTPSTRPAHKPVAASNPAENWISLFDGHTLGHWKPIEYGGEAEIRIKDGQLILPRGELQTGVVWDGPPPMAMNYEISLEAMRVLGTDFFCGLTFPYGETHASLIIGGWGGGVCGISSVDGNDAANNETSSGRGFENGKWYHIRLRCTPNRIVAMIDHETIVDLDTTDRQISTRRDIDLAKPLGLSSYQTTAALRNIRMRHWKGEPTKGR